MLPAQLSALHLRKEPAALAGVAVAIFLVVFFEVPVIGYSQSLAIPNDYQPEAYAACSSIYTGAPGTVTAANSTGFNATQLAKEFQNCLSGYAYPPYEVSGRATLAYDFFGVGTSPFPAQVEFSQGNFTAIVLTNGRAATSAYEFYVPGKNLTINPQGTVEILNASIQQTGYGNLAFAAAVKNIGTTTLAPVGVSVFGVPFPPYTTFSSVYDGLTWYQMGAGDNCAPVLLPGHTCDTEFMLGNVTFASAEFSYTVGVVGADKGNLFYYTQDFVQASPQPGLNQGWVSLFISQVNQARAGTKLTENSTLDRFAAQRFKTASTQPQISDYGFASDAASFFGRQVSNSSVAELLLFPGSAPPYLYATELQGSGPHHWSALVNPAYSQFGYYAGEAPYYEVSANCHVTEVPLGGVNITEYFESHGCEVTPVAKVTWLVIILAP